MKITKQINHDSLWVKIQDQKTKSWGKILVNRSGIKGTIKCNEDEKSSFNTIVKQMFDHMKNENGSNGEKLESLYLLLQKKYSN